MPRIQLPVYQNNLADGGVNSGGFLHFYENRSDPPVYKSIFSTPAEDAEDEIANPIELTDQAYTPDVYGTGAYTIVCEDQDGGHLWTRNDVIISSVDGQYSDWSPIKSYFQFAIVRAEDGQYYRSLVSENINNNPTDEGSPEQWTRIAFISYWNAEEIYNGEVIVIHNNLLWTASASNNQGNEPGPGSGIWTNPSDGFPNPMTNLGDLIVGGAVGAPARFAAPTGAGLTYLLSYDVDTSSLIWVDADDFAGGGGGGSTDPEFTYVDLGNVATAGSETIDIDLDLGNRFLFSMEGANATGTLTFTVSNMPAAPWEFELVGRRAGRKAIAFPADWEYNQGIVPTLDGNSGFYSHFHIRKESFFSANGVTITLLTQQDAP